MGRADGGRGAALARKPQSKCPAWADGRFPGLQQCCQKGRPLMGNDAQDTEETVRDVGRRLSQAEWREGALAQCARQSRSERW